MLSLTVTKGPDRGAEFKLDGSARVVIGRNSPDLKLNDIMISRYHARIKFEGGKWTVRDLGSRNGTKLNGARLIAPSVLRTGDRIETGYTEFEVKLITAADGAEIAKPAPMPLASSPMIDPEELELEIAPKRGKSPSPEAATNPAGDALASLAAAVSNAVTNDAGATDGEPDAPDVADDAVNPRGGLDTTAAARAAASALALADESDEAESLPFTPPSISHRINGKGHGHGHGDGRLNGNGHADHEEAAAEPARPEWHSESIVASVLDAPADESLQIIDLAPAQPIEEPAELHEAAPEITVIEAPLSDEPVVTVASIVAEPVVHHEPIADHTDEALTSIDQPAVDEPVAPASVAPAAVTNSPAPEAAHDFFASVMTDVAAKGPEKQGVASLVSPVESPAAPDALAAPAAAGLECERAASEWMSAIESQLVVVAGQGWDEAQDDDDEAFIAALATDEVQPLDDLQRSLLYMDEDEHWADDVQIDDEELIGALQEDGPQALLAEVAAAVEQTAAAKVAVAAPRNEPEPAGTTEPQPATHNGRNGNGHGKSKRRRKR